MLHSSYNLLFVVNAMPPLFSSSLLPPNPLFFSYSSSKLTINKINITSCSQQTNPNPNDDNNNNNNIPFKIPTPPWLPSPLILPQDHQLLINVSQPNPEPTNKPQSTAYKSLTQGVRGGRGRQAMKKIIHGIKNLNEIDPQEENLQPQQLEQQMPIELTTNVPWAKVEEKMVFRREKKVREVTAAERDLSEDVLMRLRGEAKALRKWVKAKKAGVTQQVVDDIVKGWRKEELVTVKFVDPLRRNMDRAREILEVTNGYFVD